MSIFLGPNPVDSTLAFRAAVESSLDVISSINECCENSRDYGKNVIITLNGNPSSTTSGQIIIDLTSVIIEDDGIGMDFATLYEKFRGAYYDSKSHDRVDQSGRNGLGVKTNLQYWKEIYVKTTTRGLIPHKSEWSCSDSNRDKIEEVYHKVSNLKPGSSDTEERRMILRVDGSELLPFTEVNRDDAYTVVELRFPRQKITLNVEEFIKKQSHCIEWLTKPDHKMTVVYRNLENKVVKKDIRPFYEIDGKDKFICHVKGVSNQEMFVHYYDMSGTKQAHIIPVPTDFLLDPIEIDIKVLDKDSDDTNPNDFVISICGANIYDRKARSVVSPAIEYLLSQHHYKMSSGFSYRLHGYVKTQDERLKRALRHNKSVLDEEDKYARMFINYLGENILKPLNQFYYQYVSSSTEQSERDILDEISKEFNNVMVRIEERRKQKRTEKGETGQEPKHKEYKCASCGLVWKTPLDKTPSYCAEFSISSKEGCGSRDISRNSHARNSSGPSAVKFKWVSYLGNFLPSRYEESENTIYLSSNHPSFMIKGSGSKVRQHKVTVGIEQAFFAIAIHQSAKEGRPIHIVYGECLREWFENKSNRDPLKIITKKAWREAGLTIDQI